MPFFEQKAVIRYRDDADFFFLGFSHAFNKYMSSAKICV